MMFSVAQETLKNFRNVFSMDLKWQLGEWTVCQRGVPSWPERGSYEWDACLGMQKLLAFTLLVFLVKNNFFGHQSLAPKGFTTDLEHLRKREFPIAMLFYES